MWYVGTRSRQNNERILHNGKWIWADFNSVGNDFYNIIWNNSLQAFLGQLYSKKGWYLCRAVFSINPWSILEGKTIPNSRGDFWFEHYGQRPIISPFRTSPELFLVRAVLTKNSNRHPAGCCLFLSLFSFELERNSSQLKYWSLALAFAELNNTNQRPSSPITTKSLQPSWIEQIDGDFCTVQLLTHIYPFTNISIGASLGSGKVVPAMYCYEEIKVGEILVLSFLRWFLCIPRLVSDFHLGENNTAAPSGKLAFSYI